MSNTLLTIDMITKEALRILHQKLSLVGNIHREYDSSFASKGAKIGNTLRVRKPPKYTVDTGATMSAQDATETYVDLTANTQSHVALSFSSNELTMKIDEFSGRFIKPAMTALASSIEASVADTLCDAAYNTVTLPTTAVDFADVAMAREQLTNNLAPYDERTICMAPKHVTGFLGDTKGLFQDSSQISAQYREGMLGRISGFDAYENTLIGSHTVGAGIAGTPLSAGSAQDGATINIDGLTDGTASGLLKGDIITFAGTYACHDETKDTLGHLKQFTVTADAPGTSAEAIAVPISPTIVASGAFQNVSQAVADGSAVVLHGAANAVYQRSLAFHKDVGAFATADLLMPQGVDMASRQVQDGISMRIVRQYTIATDLFPCRCDILWGAAALYPELGTTIRF